MPAAVTTAIKKPLQAAPMPAAAAPATQATPAPWRGGAYGGARPAGFTIPSFVQGKDESDRWNQYLIYLKQHPEAPGNRILHNMTGFKPGSGFTPPGATTTVAPPNTPVAAPRPAPGAPGPPVYSAPSPPPAPGGGGQPPPGWGGQPPGYPPGAGLPGATPSPNAFNDPFAMFLSAVPAMRVNTQRQLAQGMADAGFTGNRWGTSAMDRAGQIGAESAMRENALLQKTLSDYANQTENRALQATGMGVGLGGMLDELARNRVTMPFSVGQWEQGRADQFAKFPYEDFERSKLGWLPMMLQAAMSQGAGSPGQIYQTTEPGKPGAIDWASLLGGLFT